jgi:hypothetical protein
LKLGRPPYELTCYWPINLLPTTFKIFETLLLKRFFPMVENNRLIQRHSTTEQTHQIIQRINEALDNKQYCSAAFLGISQAFNKVRHTRLLYKLGWSRPLNYFLVLKSYLHRRRFLIEAEIEYTER